MDRSTERHGGQRHRRENGILGRGVGDDDYKRSGSTTQFVGTETVPEPEARVRQNRDRPAFHPPEPATEGWEFAPTRARQANIRRLTYSNNNRTRSVEYLCISIFVFLQYRLYIFFIFFFGPNSGELSNLVLPDSLRRAATAVAKHRTQKERERRRHVALSNIYIYMKYIQQSINSTFIHLQSPQSRRRLDDESKSKQ